jgi:hypothetical protein
VTTSKRASCAIAGRCLAAAALRQPLRGRAQSRAAAPRLNAGPGAAASTSLPRAPARCARERVPRNTTFRGSAARLDST